MNSDFKQVETGEIPEEWQTDILGNVTTYISRGVTPCYCDANGVTVYNQKCIRSGQVNDFEARLTDINKKTISKEKYLVPNDILINSTGQGTLGRVGQIHEINAPSTVDSHITIVRADKTKIHPIYLGYFLKGLQKNIEDLAEGSTGQTELSREKVKKLLINVPLHTEQQQIASILSSLDDKIELNKKVNRILEHMAKALFKHWFVDFEFPSNDGKPYKSNGGEMVKSELGLIPKNWVAKPLNEMFNFLEGPGIRNWQYATEGTRFINIRLINGGDIDVTSANFINQKDVDERYQHFLLQEGDMVVSTSGTLGKSAIVRKSHLPLLLNTSVVRFRPNNRDDFPYMYQYLQSRYFLDEQVRLASGSVQANFGPTHLLQMVVLVPDEELLNLFNMTCKDVYSLIIKNKNENDILRIQRDSLLPKLMSGRLRVT